MTLTYRPSPDGGRVLSAPPPRRSLLSRLFRRRRDEQIRHTMPWLVASGAIVPGELCGRRK